jgi:2-(1,2-epoxy-1,2-dihydrophenyl)acetyl-CoA isomerase
VSEGVRVERAGAVLVLTITRPQVANALDHETVQAMTAAVTEAATDETTRALLVAAEGAHFCSGADVSGALVRGEKPRTGHMVRGLAAGANALVAALWDFPRPVVAAVQGTAAGLGCNLTLTADFVIAGEGATFQVPFARLGFAPDSGSTWLLPRVVGVRNAKRMLLLGERLDSRRALAWGLVTEVVPDAEVSATAAAWAGQAASGATLAVSLAKRQLHHALETDLRADLDTSALGVELSIRSEDFKEGMRARQEKREPDFSGS